MSTFNKTHKHNFRKTLGERKSEALEYMQAEFPNARVTIDPHDEAAGFYCLVLEECDYSAERIDNVAEGLEYCVQSVGATRHYEHGADIFFHA